VTYSRAGHGLLEVLSIKECMGGEKQSDGGRRDRKKAEIVERR